MDVYQTPESSLQVHSKPRFRNWRSKWILLPVNLYFWWVLYDFTIQYLWSVVNLTLVGLLKFSLVLPVYFAPMLFIFSVKSPGGSLWRIYVILASLNCLYLSYINYYSLSVFIRWDLVSYPLYVVAFGFNVVRK